jgi:hypothetical protein
VPKVTLINSDHQDYHLIFGRQVYRFKGGKPKEVPVAVALEAQKKIGRGGVILFQVDDLPEIVSPNSSGEAGQNVAAMVPHQMRFESWP